MTRQISISVLGVLLAVGCTAEVSPEDVGAATAALVVECTSNADCPGPHPTCAGGICVACTGDLNQDFQVNSTDQSLFDTAFTAGDLSADINRDWWLTQADQTLLDQAKATNGCVCDPNNTYDDYTSVTPPSSSTHYAGYRFAFTMSFYSSMPLNRLLPFVTLGDYCNSTIVRDDGYGGASVVGSVDETGLATVTVYWRTRCYTPAGVYDLGLVDRITGRPIAEGITSFEVLPSSCGGGGGGGGVKVMARQSIGDGLR